MIKRLIPPTGDDPCEALYSDAYDLGVKGEPCPDVVFLSIESRAATLLGHKAGKANQEMAFSLFQNDPSSAYLIQRYHEDHKWMFEIDESRRP